MVWFLLRVSVKSLCGPSISISLVTPSSVLGSAVLCVSALRRQQSFWLGTIYFNLNLVIGKDPVLLFLLLWSSSWHNLKWVVFSGWQFKGKLSTWRGSHSSSSMRQLLTLCPQSESRVGTGSGAWKLDIRACPQCLISSCKTPPPKGSTIFQTSTAK